MASASSPTTFADIYPHIIQTHILPRLDGPSLFAAATTSSSLQALSTDQNLWSHVCKSTWPSITDPRVDGVISTFPTGHRSFFEDCSPDLINHRNRCHSWSCSKTECVSTHPWPSELISAVDIRYQNDIVYSRVEFTDTTTDFLSSALRIVLKDGPASKQFIDLKVGEVVDADDATISHLKESVTLHWILIDRRRKRAANISSIKPVLAWITDDIHLRYVTILAGCEPNEMVECRIEVRLVVGKGGVGLQVREVTLHTQDLACNPLTGKEFLVITGRAILEESGAGRKQEGVGGHYSLLLGSSI